MKFFAKATGKKRGEMYLYDSIGQSWDGGITDKSFEKGLRELGAVDELDIYVNSPGGNVFHGVAIYNQLKRHGASRKTVHIDGIAASIASVIIMAGTEIKIATNGMVMIHDPFGLCMGSANEMRKSADALDKVRSVLLDTYVARTGGKSAQISEWMTEETWMNADEAVARGFATSKTADAAIKAEFPMLANFAKLPDNLKRDATSVSAKLASMNMRTLRMRSASAAAA
jgi:ATP-dependent Clp protease protease subunit